jgi:hypothetical protein
VAAAWAARAAEAAPDLVPEHCRIVRELIPFEEIERRINEPTE